MSNTLAVAMVTAALRRILGEALAGVPAGGVPNARVTTLRPDLLPNADGEARGINLFLYQVTPNGAWTGTDLPTRRPDGTLVTRPHQALDLHYLFTFSGDEAALEPQRALGVAISTLAAQPVLGRDLIREIIARDTADDPTTWEQYSDLADQVDLVRFTCPPQSLEKLSRIWAMFPQSAYRLSVTCQAAVVLLEPDLTPQPALPVRTRGVDATAGQVPSITWLGADSGPTNPVLPGSVLRIEGRNLRGAFDTRVRLDEMEVTVPPGQVTGTRITLVLPSGVPAGVRAVQVSHPRLVGTPPVERVGVESAAVALVLRPVITGTVTATPGAEPGLVDVTVPLDPPVGRRQRVVLDLNEHHPPPDREGRGYRFVAPLPGPAAPDVTPTVTVPVRDVPAGRYLVRVWVDGAQSVLLPGVDGRYDTPAVQMP